MAMEIRIELQDDDLIASVLDARKQADPTVSRTKLIEEVLRDWASKQLHTATLIVRVAGRHGDEVESKRGRSGG